MSLYSTASILGFFHCNPLSTSNKFYTDGYTMKDCSKGSKVSFRFSILFLVIVASFLGCVKTPTSQSIHPSTNAALNYPSKVETTATQEVALQPSFTSTTLPISTLTLQPSQTTVIIKPVDVSSTPMASPSSNTINEMLDQVDKNRALDELHRLIGDIPICNETECHIITNRETGSEGLQWVKDYIYAELVSLGYSVELQDWSKSGYSDQNLIARKPGRVSTDKEIYFIAHMDGVNPQGAQRSPAADDNASGVVDILELARILSSRLLSRTVVLFFSTGEEHGALGVKSYIDQLSPDQLNKIWYVVDVDMVSYDSNFDGEMQLWSGDHSQSQDFAHMFGRIIDAYQLGLVPNIVTGCT